jgi:hypothetical protein
VGEVWHFLLQIDEQFAQKTILTPKVGLFVFINTSLNSLVR